VQALFVLAISYWLGPVTLTVRIGGSGVLLISGGPAIYRRTQALRRIIGQRPTHEAAADRAVDAGLC